VVTQAPFGRFTAWLVLSVPELVLLLDVPPLSDAGFPDAGECLDVGRPDFALPDPVAAGLLSFDCPSE